jgi:hypothetical protein
MRLFTEGNGSGRACCSSGRSKWDKQAPEYCQAFETRRIMTKQERRIARELAVIYFIFTFIWGGSYMTTDWGNVPQWITAGVAVSAVTVAAVGIAIQRSVARKRAAIDFFLKTEGDKQLLDAYDNFWSGIETMKKMPINVFCTSSDLEVRKDYFAVRKYLNEHELVAIGIKNGMFDKQTCYDFWCGVLCRCVEAAQPVLAHVRARPGHSATYSELESLYREWKERDIRAGTHK